VGDARRTRPDGPIRQRRIAKSRKRQSEKEVEGEPVSPEHGEQAVQAKRRQPQGSQSPRRESGARTAEVTKGPSANRRWPAPR